MILREQFNFFIKDLATRKRRPVKPSTISTYQSIYNKWIGPKLANTDISEIENGIVKAFVSHLHENKLSVSSINTAITLLKNIIHSAMDVNGNQIYTKNWNVDFIDLPLVRANDRKTPCIIDAEALQKALERTSGWFRVLCVLGLGSGCRIGELLSLKNDVNDLESSIYDAKTGKLIIRKGIYRGREVQPKTTAGNREIDLCPELNEYLAQNIRNDGYLFKNKRGRIYRQEELYRNLKAAGIEGFHSMRRYRVSHLRNERIPEDIIRYWIGHSSATITDRYSKLAENISERKRYANQAGLGFQIPKN
jgi:integrase